MIADRPDLADETSYVAIKGEQAKTQAAAGDRSVQCKNSLVSVNPQWDQLETNINWLAAPEHRQAVLAALAQSEYATTGQSGRFANWLGYTGKDVLDAKRLLDQVRNEGFTTEFKNTKNIRSNTEANRIGASFSSLFSPTITPDGAQAELDRLTGMVRTGGRISMRLRASRFRPNIWTRTSILTISIRKACSTMVLRSRTISARCRRSRRTLQSTLCLRRQIHRA